MSLAYFGGLSGVAHLAFTIHARQTPCLPLIDDPHDSSPPTPTGGMIA
jgi:hypothetical protein